MQKCADKDCGVCTNTYYGYWTKQEWQGLYEIIYWEHVIRFICFNLFGYLVFGWIGVFLGSFLFQVWFWIGGGLAPYLPIPDDPIPEPCSAGIENCEVCGNGWRHEDNVERVQNYRWYQRYH